MILQEKFKKELDVEVKASHTFADVLDKYNKKIGLQKLIDEFFHQDKIGWNKHQTRDKEKAEWLSMNKILLIELPFNKKPEWEKIIDEAYQKG